MKSQKIKDILEAIKQGEKELKDRKTIILFSLSALIEPYLNLSAKRKLSFTK